MESGKPQASTNIFPSVQPAAAFAPGMSSGAAVPGYQPQLQQQQQQQQQQNQQQQQQFYPMQGSAIDERSVGKIAIRVPAKARAEPPRAPQMPNRRPSMAIDEQSMVTISQGCNRMEHVAVVTSAVGVPQMTMMVMSNNFGGPVFSAQHPDLKLTAGGSMTAVPSFVYPVTREGHHSKHHCRMSNVKG
ncbi:AF4/FMR2 family member lilli-like [Anopheles darlingi]|uniref:AF4/FMR2 family member lilli-like n=1 Tax=Anopheles darlingi TaxID=43151 RepID=UPI00210060AC|nr:AF4/FMR2 family member lilli-like [Anopheles darlingi]